MNNPPSEVYKVQSSLDCNIQQTLNIILSILLALSELLSFRKKAVRGLTQGLVHVVSNSAVVSRFNSKKNTPESSDGSGSSLDSTSPT